MRVHTVVAGENLRVIAEQNGTTTAEIVRLNELDNPNVIVPGLHLLVPGPPTLAQMYGVRKGDTLERLSRRFGIPQAQLSRWLGIPVGASPLAGTALQVGDLIYPPQPITNRRTIEVNGYLLPQGNPSDGEIVRDVGEHLTYLGIFSYQARSDGSLQPKRDNAARQGAKEAGVSPLLTMTNFDGNQFNPELAHMLLANQGLRRKLIDNALNTAKNLGFSGVNVDFEHMHAEDRTLYNTFIRELGQSLHSHGLSLSIAVGPKTADMPGASWMGAFDYHTLGAEVDFLMLMTYEWGWVGGPPMAVAPLDQVRAVLRYAVSQIPPAKILMGMSLYGYDWQIPYPSGRLAASISNNSAQNMALSMKVPILWNAAAASPYYRYHSTEGPEHEVWFDDPLSAAAKLQLVSDFGLRGVSVWVLGNEFPQFWYLVGDSFEVRKV
ncbi:LysM peptidoglycan-binding domain-containing protein [Alicyclobacillaceae bacterium I2511]|nr:LysM peptidoglycan-binding domain-containing protein [Alicyclobacillaceae bacterium I2511]